MFNQNYPLCTSFPNQVYKFIQSLLNLENSSATKKNLVDIFDYKLYSLSFANWGDLSLTRALLSTLFQNPGGGGGWGGLSVMDRRTDGQCPEILVSNIVFGIYAVLSQFQICRTFMRFFRQIYIPDNFKTDKNSFLKLCVDALFSVVYS